MLRLPRLNPRPRRNPLEFVVYHADHGIKPEQMDWIKSQISAANPKTFFIQEIQIPAELGSVRNAMYGPAAGDPPVPESQVSYRPRGDRPWSDRVVSWPTRPVNYVQAIGSPDRDDPNKIVLFTVYGGPLAPQNPDDPSCRDVDGARNFWSQHALSLEQWEPKKNPRKKKQFTYAEQWGTPRMTDAQLLEVINWPFDPKLDWDTQQHRRAHAEACQEELDRRRARKNPRSQEELAQLYLAEFSKYQAMAAVTSRLSRELAFDPGDFDTLEKQYNAARAAELAQLRKYSDIFDLLTQETKDKYLRARVSARRNPKGDGHDDLRREYAKLRDEGIRLAITHKFVRTRDPELLRKSFDEMVENVRRENGIDKTPEGYVLAAHWTLNLIKVPTLR